MSCSLPLIVVFCGIIYISILPDPPHPDDISKFLGGIPLNDKVGHLVMFIGLGFLISNFLEKMFKCLGLKNVVRTTGLSFVVGIIHEIDQHLTGRGYEVDDLFFDLLGGFLGALAFNLFTRINQRLSKESADRKSPI
ncbi:MAG: VanZ family protein [Desulfomonilaceae bacterium]